MQLKATFQIVGLDDETLNGTTQVCLGYHYVDTLEPDPGFMVEFRLDGERMLVPETNTRLLANPEW